MASESSVEAVGEPGFPLNLTKKQQQVIGHDDRCLADLRVTDPRLDKARIEATKGGLLEDSYRWFLDHEDFLRWRDNEQTRLLWIKGDPGKGKTMLLCGIVDELSPTAKIGTQEAGTLLSYFFCQATDSRINNATAVLRGLIYLLIKQQPSLISHVQERYKDAGKLLFEDINAWTALSEIFICMVNDPSVQLIHLIIDALDECESGLQRLLKLAVQETPSSRVKWIMSSRNAHEIERQLKLHDSKMSLSLELRENADRVSEAVGAYIDNRVLQLECINDDDKLRDQVQSVLRQKANGTFLWVSLVVDELKHVESWNVEQVLDDMPTELDKLYDRMIMQLQGLRNKKDLEYCQLVLSAVTLAYRPLYLSELSVVAGLPDLIASKAQRVQRVVAMCGSFLTMRDEQVFIIHQSANDYLKGNYALGIQSGGVSRGHAFIYKRSITEMSSVLRKNMYNLSFGIKPKDMKPPQPDPLSQIRYACVFWAEHLLNAESSQCKRDLADGGIVFQFLREKFLYWVESLSLLGKLSDGVASIKRLLRAVVVNLGVSSWLAKFLGDAEKFVCSNGSILERAPLQTYGSALVFSPTMSMVKNVQWNERLSFIKIIAGIRDDWGSYRQTLEDHTNSVKAISISPDGKTMASASCDGTIRLWDAATGAHRQTLEGHTCSVNTVAFSPNSNRLASASGDNTIRLWNLVMCINQQTLKGHNDSIKSVAFSPDGKTLASASVDTTVRLWDIETGTQRQVLQSHLYSVNTVAFSPDGKSLASASDDSTIQLWDAETGAKKRTLAGHSFYINAITFFPDSQILFSASRDGTLCLWDMKTGDRKLTLEVGNNHAKDIAFSPDGRILALALNNSKIELRSTPTMERWQTLEGHGKHVNAIYFSPDGKTLASASDDGTVRLWDTAMPAAAKTSMSSLFQNPAENFPVGSRKDSWSAAASETTEKKPWGTVRPYSNTSSTLWENESCAAAIALSPNGKILATVAHDGDIDSEASVKVWNTTTGLSVQVQGLNPEDDSVCHYDLAASESLCDGKEVIDDRINGLTTADQVMSCELTKIGLLSMEKLFFGFQMIIGL